MDYFFLSDVHMFPEPEEHPGRDKFINFLSSLLLNHDPGQLWILGDLFDFWFEYRSVIPSGYDRILSAIRRLSDSGWDVNFAPGNHDFWVSEHFSRATGASIHYGDYLERNINGRNVLLAHGDGLGPGDTGYKIMKPVLRSGLSKFLFSLIHPDIATYFARIFSDTSKRILHRDLDSIPPGIEKWVQDRFEEDIDIVITGHTHLDSIIHMKNGIYVSLGDWLTRFTYCIIRNNSPEPELLSYSDEILADNFKQEEGVSDDG